MATNHSGNRSYNRDSRREQNQYGAHTGYNQHQQMRNMQGNPQQAAQMQYVNYGQYSQYPAAAYQHAAGGFERQAAAAQAQMPYPYPYPYGIQQYHGQIPHQMMFQNPHIPGPPSMPAHSSPTPPMHQQQPPSQQPQVAPQQPAPPKQQPAPRQNRRIKIVDPDTQKEIDLTSVGKTTPVTEPPPPETPEEQESHRERRNTFKDSVHSTVKSADSPVKSTGDSPAGKQKVSIMSRSTAPPTTQDQQDVTTPEKSVPDVGKEMSVQTTPSLQALAPTAPVAVASPPATEPSPVIATPEKIVVPAEPAVVEQKQQPVEQKQRPVEQKQQPELPKKEAKQPPKQEAKQPQKQEVKQPPKQEVKQPQKQDVKRGKSAEKPEPKGKKIPEPIKVKENEGKKKVATEVAKNSESAREEEKIKGETMIIEDKQEKPNGKPALEIGSIINSADKGITGTTTDEVQSSEESSASECKFETPPATPSAVILTEELPQKEEEPVVTEAPQEKEEDDVVVEEEKVEVKIEEPEREEGELTEEENEDPVERTGPFTYTRDEMIQLREAQDKPLADLPKFDCIMDKPILKCEPMKARSSAQFVPSWEASKSRSRGGDQRNRSMDKNHHSRGHASAAPRIIDHVLATPVTRKKSNNAWLAKREQDDEPKNKDARKLMRCKIVAILNKITPQNFKELSMEVMMQNIDTQDMVDLVVEIIFDKALSEPAFSETYANLCKVLCSIKLKDDPNPKVSPFRKALLNRCQKEFCREKDVEEKMDKQIHDLKHNKDLKEDERTRQKEELLYQRTKMKKKMLGNINFIGELFNLNLISPKIIICQCINTLLEIKKDEDTGLMESIDDEKIECLSKLFTTVGQKLEDECKTEDKKRLFEQHFGTYSKLQSDKNYPYRIRFMIQDVMDLRSNGWTPRRQEVKPQKIEDIHRQHEKAEQEKKMEATLAQQRNKSKSQSRDERQKGRDKSDFNQLKQQPRIDLRSIQSTMKDHGQKGAINTAQMHLGPSSFQWGRGSGGGSGANSPLSGSREDLTTTNRFEVKTRGQNLMVPGKTASAPAPRKNNDRERADAIAHVKAFNSKGRRTPSQSPVRSTSSEKVDKPDEKIKERTKVILTEYFDTEDWEEAIECIKEEIDFVKKYNVFVDASIGIVMEAKSTCTSLLGELFEKMFVHDPPQMTADGLLHGFQPAFESAADLAMDFPRIYDVFGELLAKSLAKEHITLKVLKGALEPLKSVNKAGVVMCAVIKHSLDELGSKGCMEIQRRWGKEKMSWTGLTDNPAQLIEEYKLDFLSSSCGEEGANTAPTPDLNFSTHLATLIEEKTSMDNIFKYIDEAIPKESQKDDSFIMELSLVCVKPCLMDSQDDNDSIILNEDAFSAIVPIMQKYVAQEKENNTALETAVLDSMQKLFSELSFPRDLPVIVFDKLYEQGIVSVEGFRFWKDNGKEQQGRGVLRQHLKNFFEELCSGDESDSSD